MARKKAARDASWGIFQGVFDHWRDKHLRRLRNRLHLLDTVFTKRVLNLKARAFLWPEESDFRELDECIFYLAGTVRTKKLLTHSEAILLVDQKWPKLHLEQRLLALMRAALDHPNPAPAKPRAVVHFEAIVDLAKREEAKSALAKRFLSDHFRLDVKPLRSFQIQWVDYEELLLRRDGRQVFLQCRMNLPSPAMNCYVMYLEMQRDRWLFEQEMQQWESIQREREPFYQWIEKADLHDSSLPSIRLEKQRQTERDRQTRHRKNKRMKKRDELRAACRESDEDDRPLRDTEI